MRQSRTVRRGLMRAEVWSGNESISSRYTYGVAVSVCVSVSDRSTMHAERLDGAGATFGIAQQTAHTNYRNYNATRAAYECVCAVCVCCVCVCAVHVCVCSVCVCMSVCCGWFTYRRSLKLHLNLRAAQQTYTKKHTQTGTQTSTQTCTPHIHSTHTCTETYMQAHIHSHTHTQPRDIDTNCSKTNNKMCQSFQC